jgi:hypothetical protein
METYTIQNNVFAVALGAFPLLLPIPRFHSHLRHTTSASYPRVNVSILVGKLVSIHTHGSEYLWP